MPGTISFREGQLKDSLRKSFQDLASLGPIPGRVYDYLGKGEVDASAATDDVLGLQRSMWSFLKSRGASLSDQAKFDNGDYDEILFGAYDNAIRERSGSGSDPLARVKSGDPSSIGAGWDFSVDMFETIEEQGVLSESILAAGAIDYVYVLGDQLRVFDIAEELVLGWANGNIDIAEGAAAGKLYRYWKNLDDRMPASDRAMLYRRVLDKGSVDVMRGATANTNFPMVWNKLLAEIADYIEKSEKIESGLSDTSPVSSKPIYQSLRELQYNLTDHCTGMAAMQVREMYAQLQDAFDLLRDPSVIASFGGVRRRNMWTVISEVWREAFGTSPAISPMVRVACEGNKIFQLAATFDEGTFSPDDLAELVQAGENYIINQAMAGATGDATQDASEDDGFDSGFADEFDDF